MNQYFKKRIPWRALAVFNSLMLPAVAHADMFTPPDGDVFMQMLNQLFSKLLDFAGWEGGANTRLYLGTGSDPFQYMLEFISYVAVILGTSMAAFAIIKSLLESATDGVPFTKDIGGWFYFTRTFISTALLVPIFSGYGGGQILLAWLFTGSVGISASEWMVFLEIAQDGDNPNTRTLNANQRGNIRSLYSIKVPAPEVAELTYKMFEGFTCMYGVASEKVFADYAKAYNANKNEQLKQSQLNSAVPDSLAQRQAAIAANNGGVEASPISVVPNNAQSNGTASTTTGYTQVTQHNEELQGQQVRQANIQNAEKTNQALADADKAAYVKARKEYVTTKKLNEAYDLVSTGTEGKKPSLAVSKGFYAFGLPVQTEDTGGVEKMQGYACGYVDFNRTGVSQNRINRFQETTARAASESKSPFVGTAKDELNESFQRKTGESSPVQDVVLTAYINLMNDKYRLKIQEIARDYVDEVNQVYREVQVEKNGYLTKPNGQEAEAIRERAQGKAIQKLDTLTESLEKDVIDHIMNNLYKKSSSGETNNYMDFLAEAQKKAKDEGAATAGMYFMALQYSISKIQSLTRLMPTISPSAQDSTPESYENLVGNVGINSLNNSVKNNVGSYYGWISTFAGKSSYPVMFNKFENQYNGQGTNPMLGLALGIDVKNMADTARHPMVMAIEAGHNIIHSVNQYQDAVRAQAIRNKKNGDAGYASQSAMGGLIASILVLGILLAYFLPAIPLLSWLGSMMGVMFSFILMVFAAPIWLATHVVPDGSKYAGKGNAGYARVLSELIRFPALVFGLGASIICIQVFGIFALDIFARGSSLMYDDGLYASNNAQSLDAIIGSVAVYVVLAIFLYQMLTKLMTFPNMLADGVPSFWGAPNGNTSEFAQHIGGQEAKGQVSSFGSAGGSVFGTSPKVSSAQVKADTQAITSEHAAGANGTTTVAPTYPGANGQTYTYSNAGGKSTTSPPTSAADKSNFVATADNAYTAATQSGYSSDEAQQLASQYASQAYSNADAREAMARHAQNPGSSRELFEQMKQSGDISMFTNAPNEASSTPTVQSGSAANVPGNTSVTPTFGNSDGGAATATFGDISKESSFRRFMQHHDGGAGNSASSSGTATATNAGAAGSAPTVNDSGNSESDKKV